MNDWRDKSVLVLGLGASGLAMARWCVRHGAQVTVADTRQQPPQLAALQAQCPNAAFVGGEFDARLTDGVAWTHVLRSPGLAPQDWAVVREWAAQHQVPVGVARAMGADIVIAVDLNTDFTRRQLTAQVPLKAPSMLDVITSSINVMQSRIARSRMAGEPPEVVIAPRLGDIGLLDFHRGAEAIAHGERAAQVVLPALKELGLAQGA